MYAFLMRERLSGFGGHTFGELFGLGLHEIAVHQEQALQGDGGGESLSALILGAGKSNSWRYSSNL
jgi:hypothetical protein